MGLTSASATPKRDIGLLSGNRGGNETPASAATPTNILDSLRKANVLNTTGIKEHERILEELKKENFDMKLRCFHLEEQLRKNTPGNVQSIFQENEFLKAANEAQALEMRTIKELLQEAQKEVEHQRRSTSMSAEAENENKRLSQELEMTRNQLQRTQNQTKSYEQQLELFDQESREMMKRMKQMELEINANQKRHSEATRNIQMREEEIKELNQELSEKCSLIQQNHQELQNAHTELEVEMRKNQDLENRLKMAENERDAIRAELDPIRRRFAEGLKDPGSPRSSIDLLEASLLRQVGTTTKQLEVLSKTNELTQGEKEKLMAQSQRLMNEVTSGVRSIVILYEKIAMATRLATQAQLSSINSAEMTLDQAVGELAKLLEVVISEFSDAQHQREALTHDLRSAHDELAFVSHSSEKAKEGARLAQEKLSSVEKQLETTHEQLVQSQSNQFRLEQSLKATQELELPKYREQCVTLQNAIKTLETELSARDRRCNELRTELDNVRRRCVELEAEISQNATSAHMRHEEVATVRRQQEELLNKLSMQEDLNAQLGKKLDDVTLQLTQAERVKSAVEESFQRQIKNLHQSTNELRSQLAQASSGKSTNDQRIERLQGTVNYLETTYEECLTKLQVKEAAYSSLLREHELASIERETLDRDLQEVREILAKTEGELSRMKRLEYTSRRGNEDMEATQNKLNSLTTMNSYLREQVENKDKALREASEKVRRQQDAIDKAYADCEAQHQKIKKRELIINRVLKRLENINALTGIGNVMDEEVVGSMAPAPDDSPSKRHQF